MNLESSIRGLDVTDDDKASFKAVLGPRAFSYLLTQPISTQCSLISTCNDENLPKKLSDLVNRPNAANFSWNYAIFWQLLRTKSGDLVLGWKNGSCREPSRFLGTRREANTQQMTRKMVLEKLSALLGGRDGVNYACGLGRVTDTKLFFLASMYFLFPRGEGGPGRCFQSGKHEWRMVGPTTPRDYYVRSHLMTCAGIQTVVFIPTVFGVVELGSIGFLSENLSFVESIRSLFSPCSTHNRGKQLPKVLNTAETSDGKRTPKLFGQDLNAGRREKISSRKPEHEMKEASSNGNEYLSLEEFIKMTLDAPVNSVQELVGDGREKGSMQIDENPLREDTERLETMALVNSDNQRRKRERKLASRRDDEHVNKVEAKRLRKESIKQLFSMLGAVLPNITKMDKESLLRDAIAYITENENNKIKQVKSEKVISKFDIESFHNEVVVSMQYPRDSCPLKVVLRVFEEAKITILDSGVETIANDIAFRTFVVKPFGSEHVMRQKLSALLLSGSNS